MVKCSGQGGGFVSCSPKYIIKKVLAGTEDITVRLPIADFIPHKAVEGYTVVGQFQPGGQIIMQPNSTATSWVDFRELVAAQDVDIYDQEGELQPAP